MYVVDKLQEDGYEVTGFFNNPNIHPIRELEFREKELRRVAAMKNWNVVYPEQDWKNWFQLVKGYEKEPERGARCSICFHMRLEKTFQYAKENNFDFVASTLSISPYKVTAQINHEGEKLAQQYGVQFLPESFKKQDGFNKGKKMAVELGIQHQDYCGCVYSKVEKKLKTRNK